VCAEGMGGALCGICEPTWVMSSTDFCVQCPKDVAGLQFGVALVLVTAFLLLYYVFVLRPLLVDSTREEGEGATTTTRTGGRASFAECVRGASWLAEATGLKRVINSRMGQMLAAPFIGVYERIVLLVAAFLNNSGAEVLKVLISFAQVSGSFLRNYSIKWPPALQNFFQACTVFTIKIKALPGSLACAFTHLSYTHMQWVYLWGPLALLIAISLPAAYVSIRSPRHPRYDAVMKDWAWISTFVLFLIYPLVSGPALVYATIRFDVMS